MRHKLLQTSATQTYKRIPVELLDEATVQRARMRKLAEYWLGDKAPLAAQLEAFRQGPGRRRGAWLN